MPEILIPRSAAERRQVLKCFCGKRFPMEECSQWVRHTKSCVKKHGDQIEEMAEERKRNGFLSPSDTELYEHIRKGGN